MGFLGDRFNIGLIKSNLRMYFHAKTKGATHKVALDIVIETRYPLSQDNQMLVRHMLMDVSENLSEKDELEKLIHIMFNVEGGTPPSIKVLSKFDEIYESFREKI